MQCFSGYLPLTINIVHGNAPVRIHQHLLCRIPQIEFTIQSRHKADRKLQTFTFMDRHDPDNIRLLGKKGRFSKIHIIFLQLLHIADKLKQPMITGRFKFHRLFQQHFQIGTSLLPARKCCHIFDIMETAHHCLRKLRHGIRHCLLPELTQHLQGVLYLFSQQRIFCLLRIFCQKHIFPEAFVQASAARCLSADHRQLIFRKSHKK